jgi:hypothetical protein
MPQRECAAGHERTRARLFFKLGWAESKTNLLKKFLFFFKKPGGKRQFWCLSIMGV